LLFTPACIILINVLTVRAAEWHTSVEVAIVHPLPIEEKVRTVGISPDIRVVLVVVDTELSGVQPL
jgi:hypothetical protein